jgi:poly-beta-1,6-N-acetyl-D-glucosamine synthase
MIYLLIFVFIFYYLLLLALIAGWQIALQKLPQEGNGLATPVSVIIPFRNEASNLSRLMTELTQQDYSEYNIILVDDHSTDQGNELAAQLVASDKRFQLVMNRGAGKKSALTTGIELAAGSIIVTTDADCTRTSAWLSSIVGEFNDENVKLAFGPVKVASGSDLFTSLQSMEFATVLGTGVAAFGLGVPLYCNGANLAFRRETFVAVRGYEGNMEIPSGDDEFLLKKIMKQFPRAIRFVNDPLAVVSTFAQRDLPSLIDQRLRWAGKWRSAATPASTVVAIAFAIVQIAVLSAFVLMLADQQRQTLMYILFGKALLEYVFIFLVQQFLREKPRLFPFLVLSLIYPLYFLGVGVWSQFATYTWKGRVSKNNA